MESGRVRVVEGDVRDTAALADAARGDDGVFHLAVLPLGPSVQNPRLALDVNVVGTFNVIEAAQQAGAQKVVYSSASSVYGDTDDTMDESHPLDAWTMYGASKIAGEYFLRAFKDPQGLDYVTLRYMNVYGPRQAEGSSGRARAHLAGESPVIAGDGSQSFDFVHVADVAGQRARDGVRRVGRGVQRRQRRRGLGSRDRGAPDRADRLGRRAPVSTLSSECSCAGASVRTRSSSGRWTGTLGMASARGCAM